MDDSTIKILAFILSGVAAVAGFLYWHFKTVNGFKDDIHKLELKFKDLEQRDNLQQHTIDKLSELYPLLKTIFEQMNGGKNG